MLTRGQLRRGK